MENKFTLDAKIFKAFCDENRLRILAMLQSGEKCACVLLEKMNITQPTLSHHMKILCDSGIVSFRKEGKWTYYSIDKKGSQYAINLLQEIVSIENNTVNMECC